MALFDPEREVRIDPADAAAAVHRFLRQCRGWAAEREIPQRAEAVRSQPESAAAAKLHAWVAYLEFTDHALQELESGALDAWFEQESE